MLPVLEQHFGSAQALVACERDLQELLRARGIFFGEGLLPTYAYAFLAPRAQIDRWASQADRLIESVERAAQRLVTDHRFYESMGLSDQALKLVRVHPGYNRICVLCRPDGIPVGQDVKFVEINSDSPAMMMFIDVVAQCLLELDAFAWLRPHKPPSAADRLLETLIDCYREYGGARTPTIAIADWEGQKTRYEHKRLAEHFTAHGYETLVCDPRAFKRIDGELRVDDRRIDLVYRRALASEMIARASEIGPLLDAYTDGTVCMVNPLRSFVGGAKSVLSYIANETEAIPRTLLLDSQKARDIVRSSPSKWVLKKSESHGGENVILPDRANRAAWNAALDSSTREMWIAQEYIGVPQIAVSIVEGDSVVQVPKHYNWNPFMFGGRYAGGLVRVSSTPLINITLGGGLLPTFCT
jgi:hypothetical protein